MKQPFFLIDILISLNDSKRSILIIGSSFLRYFYAEFLLALMLPNSDLVTSFS